MYNLRGSVSRKESDARVMFLLYLPDSPAQCNSISSDAPPPSGKYNPRCPHISTPSFISISKLLILLVFFSLVIFIVTE